MPVDDAKRERLIEYGKELRRRRLNAGYSRSYLLADEVGISRGTMSDYETQTRLREPRDDNLEAFERLLNWPKAEQLAVLRGIEPDFDIDAMVDQIPADQLPRLLERVAHRLGRGDQPPPPTAARQLSEAPPGETFEESERRSAAAAKRAAEGRPRGPRPRGT